MSDAPIDPRARSARMQAVTVEAAQFGALTPLGPYQLLVAQPGERVNHVLHLLLSLLTCGLWVVPWIVLAVGARRGEQHVVSVDEAGRVWVDNELRREGLGLR